MAKPWVARLLPLTAWLVVAVLVGLVLGRVFLWLALALAGYLGYTLRNLHLLERMLAGEPRVPVLATHGVWAEVFARVARLKAKLRSRKKKYNRLLREIRESTGALSDGGVILNARYEIVWLNPAATRLLGLDATRDAGNRIDNLLRHPAFIRYLNEPHGNPVEIPSPCGAGQWLAVQLIPYGRQQHLAIVRDITAARRLERTRRDFVANASHELRSPLTVIGGYLGELGDDSDLPLRWTKPVAEMQRQASRMTRILQDLLDLARLTSGDGEAPRRFVDMPQLLRQTVAGAALDTGMASVHLTLAVEVGLAGSESELQSIISNLLDNARRFTAPTGCVDIGWRCDDAGAVLDVTDSGIGIAADQIPRLTERFYRVDLGRSRESGGTGLGLAIVKHALERHGARLVITSREGEGSCFSCRFPAARVVVATAANV